MPNTLDPTSLPLFASEPTEEKIHQLKQQAKILSKDTSFSEARALDHLARETVEQTTPVDKRILLDQNLRCLVEAGANFAVFEPTNTGLRKSILDATAPVRNLFSATRFHHYDSQGQGKGHKVIKAAYLVRPESSTKSRVSLYRPQTKSGDPRMWFRHLPSYASAEDKVAILILGETAYLLNLTDFDITRFYKTTDNPVGLLFSRISKTSDIADELLGKLRDLARSPIRATKQGDTAIGMAIEEALGISANSSKQPDYKGIELKAGRSPRNRTTLFAQVADWQNSPYKSSAAILDAFGYDRDGDFKLYCTVSTQRENTQGLEFICRVDDDVLEEHHEKEGLVARWSGELLRGRLAEKHHETMWVNAESVRIGGIEHFNLKTVTYTRQPLLNQLLPLIQSGVVTMDHLIKRSKKTKKVSEKGPLFKINKRDLALLFPRPIKYRLVIE